MGQIGKTFEFLEKNLPKGMTLGDAFGNPGTAFDGFGEGLGDGLPTRDYKGRISGKTSFTEGIRDWVSLNNYFLPYPVLDRSPAATNLPTWKKNQMQRVITKKRDRTRGLLNQLNSKLMNALVTGRGDAKDMIPQIGDFVLKHYKNPSSKLKDMVDKSVTRLNAPQLQSLKDTPKGTIDFKLKLIDVLGSVKRGLDPEQQQGINNAIEQIQKSIRAQGESNRRYE